MRGPSAPFLTLPRLPFALRRSHGYGLYIGGCWWATRRPAPHDQGVVKGPWWRGARLSTNKERRKSCCKRFPWRESRRLLRRGNRQRRRESLTRVFVGGMGRKDPPPLFGSLTWTWPQVKQLFVSYKFRAPIPNICKVFSTLRSVFIEIFPFPKPPQPPALMWF